MQPNKVTETIRNNSSAWIENLARMGYSVLGIVYCLVGGLTAMAAFGMRGGEKASQEEALVFLLRQPMGKIMLGLVAVGLLGYVVWQAVQIIKDPQHSDSDDAKGYGRRIGYAISGVGYFMLSLYAFRLAFGASTDKGGNGNEYMVAKVLNYPAGKWILLLVAAGIIGFSLKQLYQAFSGRFMKFVQQGRVNSKVLSLYEKAGRLGYFSRGVVSAIIGYFLGKAALTYNPNAAADTESAFHFLESTSVPYLLGIVALGLVFYGVFMFVRARHQRFSI